jgi:hypothetical protein
MSPYVPAEQEIAWQAYRALKARGYDAHRALAGAAFASKKHALDAFASKKGMDQAVWRSALRGFDRFPGAAAIEVKTYVVFPLFDDTLDGAFCCT